MKKLRWGCLGTAAINSKVFPFIDQSENSQLTAIASRSVEKLSKYEGVFSNWKAFNSYVELLNSRCIDVLYLSLPNSLHFEWAKIALSNGIHVLCEKPLVMKLEHFEELKHIALKKGVLMEEAFMYRHHKQCDKILETLPRLGNLKALSGRFNIRMNDLTNIRCKPELGGGSLWDVGCYLANFLAYIIQECPTKAHVFKDLHFGLEVGTRALLEFSDVQVLFECSFRGPREEAAVIQGDLATLKISKPFKPTDSEKLELWTAEKTETIEIIDTGSVFQREIENFNRAILLGEPLKVSPIESYRTIKILEALSAKNH